MKRGKRVCKILKEIRRQIAEANDIDLITSECRFKGDCMGTCPKCEAELEYLEQQLLERQLAGKFVNLAGISAGAVAMLSPFAIQSQTPADIPTDDIAVQSVINADTIKGVVSYSYTFNGSTDCDRMPGANVLNLRTGNNVWTDADGEFMIEANIGDYLEISCHGAITEVIVVSDNTPLDIILNEDASMLSDEIVMLGAIQDPREENTLALRIIDAGGNLIPNENLTLEYVYTYANGETKTVRPRLWAIRGDDVLIDTRKGVGADGNPLKREVLRIYAEGYAKPITLKINPTKCFTRKTVKFKSKRKK